VPIEGERYFLEKELPELNELDRRVWSLDQARRFAGTLRKLFALASEEPIAGTDGAVPMDLPSCPAGSELPRWPPSSTPEPNAPLIARGRPEAQVQAMPVVQVAALYSLEQYQRIRDERYKWMNVPYWPILQPRGRGDSFHRE